MKPRVYYSLSLVDEDFELVEALVTKCAKEATGDEREKARSVLLMCNVARSREGELKLHAGCSVWEVEDDQVDQNGSE